MKVSVGFDDSQSIAKPTNSTERLMMLWGDDMSTSTEHIEEVASAVETLDAFDRDIIHQYFSERATYQRIADRLGVSKPHAWRLTQRAVDRLAEKLRNNPIITERYGNATVMGSSVQGCADETDRPG